MSLDALSAVRGLLAFVAFTELTSCVRCFFLPTPPDQGQGGEGSGSSSSSYVSSSLFSLPSSGGHPQDWDCILSHSYGAWCLVNSLVLAHLAVFTHYLPIASLAVCALATKIAFLLFHAFWTGFIAPDQVGGSRSHSEVYTTSTSLSFRI